MTEFVRKLLIEEAENAMVGVVFSVCVFVMVKNAVLMTLDRYGEDDNGQNTRAFANIIAIALALLPAVYSIISIFNIVTLVFAPRAYILQHIVEAVNV